MNGEDIGPTLQRHRLDRVEIITSAVFHEIVENNPAKAVDDMDWGQAHIILNDIVRRTLSRQMARRITHEQRAKLNRLAGSLASYLAELRHYEPLPPGYLSWFLDGLKKWNEELDKAPALGRREKLTKSDFVPEAYGLFWAIFNKEPTASAKYGRDGDKLYSPAAQFIDAVMEAVTKFFDKNDIAKRQPEFRKISADWKPLDPASLEKLLSESKSSGVVLFQRQLGARRMLGVTSENMDGDVTPAWRLHAALFSDRVRPKKPPVN